MQPLPLDDDSKSESGSIAAVAGGAGDSLTSITTATTNQLINKLENKTTFCLEKHCQKEQLRS